MNMNTNKKKKKKKRDILLSLMNDALTVALNAIFSNLILKRLDWAQKAGVDLVIYIIDMVEQIKKESSRAHVAMLWPVCMTRWCLT
jgi:hypothetical protein